MTFDEVFPALDVAALTPSVIKSAVETAAQGIDQRASELAADAIRADEAAKSAYDIAQGIVIGLQRGIRDLEEQLTTARAERGEALASGAPSADFDKSIRRLNEQRERAQDEVAARALRVSPLRRDSLVAHAAALAARRAAIAELSRAVNDMTEDLKRRWGIAWELSQAMSRVMDLYSAGWQRAHSAVAEHDAKAGAA